MQKQASSEITFYSLNIIHTAKEIETDFFHPSFPGLFFVCLFLGLVVFGFFSLLEATEGVSPKDVIWPERGCFGLAL